MPAHYRYFALALLLAPQMWENDNAIKAQMELEAEAIAGQAISDEGQEGITAFLDKREPAWP